MALLYKTFPPLRGVWKIEETEEELLAMLERKEDYLLFRESISSASRRLERLASRALLRELLGREEEVAYRFSGAPYLPRSPRCHISVSHTRGFVAVVLDKRPVGVDIEYRSDRVLKIRSRFMGLDEERHIDPAHEVEHLLLHWCAKETLFKLLSLEEVDFQEHLHVDAFPYAEEGTFFAWESKTSRRRMYELAYRVTPTYVLVWSVREKASRT